MSAGSPASCGESASAIAVAIVPHATNEERVAHRPADIAGRLFCGVGSVVTRRTMAPNDDERAEKV